MKRLVILAFSVFLLSNCSKSVSKQVPTSKITINKNDEKWGIDGVNATYDVNKDMIHVMTGKDTETFTISFKKGGIPLDGKLKEFTANVLIAPAKGSASIADSYFLDDTQPNMLKILLYENPKRRIVGDFLFYMKRDEKYTKQDETNIFNGRFDIRYDSINLLTLTRRFLQND